jgi:mannopine transport system permease protein
VLLALAFIYPVGKLVWASFATNAGYTAGALTSASCTNRSNLKILWRTDKPSLLLVTVPRPFCSGIRSPMRRTGAKGNGALLMIVCVLIPALDRSVLVRSYAWILLLQRKGIINNLLSRRPLHQQRPCA